MRNNGTVNLSGVTLADTMTRLDGTPVGSVTVAFVGADGTPPSPQGARQVGETASWTVSYVPTQADIDAVGLSNSVLATGTTPQGQTLTDLSDDDGIGASDPTIAPIAGTSALVVTKTASVPQMLFPTVYSVTFTLDVLNQGSVTQTGVQVTDPLAAFLAPATLLSATNPVVVRATGFTGGAANPAYDGVTDSQTLTGTVALAPGATGQIQIDLVYSTAAGAPAGANVACATSAQSPTAVPSNPVGLPSADTDGDGIPDSIEGCGPGDDRDGDGICDAQDFDPTGTFYCEDTGQILPGGLISVTGPFGTQTGVGSSGCITILRDGSDGRFQFFVTVPGTFRLALTYPPDTTPSTNRLDGGTLAFSSFLPAAIASLAPPSG